MDAETRAEFARRDKANMWLGGVALTVALSFGSCAIERAFTASAQVMQATAKNGEQDAELGKARETREQVVSIAERVKSVESTAGEIKAEVREQRAILEEIRREVRKQ